ncbi:unnamed protein product, partial [Lymnaea stagnalis]
MFGLSRLNRSNRLVIGIIALLIVDIVWVISGEITKYLFQETNFDKPFFTTYVKTVMFTVYLFGFIIWKPWRDQCCYRRGSPIYVPIKYDNYDSHTSGGESDDASSKFSNLSEVRQLSETYALEHNLARLSYQASIQAAEKLNILQNRLPLNQVAKLACLFCVFWFLANYTYQLAIAQTEIGIVNTLSSTSGLFTLISAAIFPSGAVDKFTLSKLAAVIVGISGIVMVYESDAKLGGDIPTGALWAVTSAACYSFYLVLVRRKVDTEDKMDIPMFFGFVGLVCALSMWPGFLILHYSKQEPFEWPNKKQWMFILLNGAIGTVLSECLWLLGCFLTSSLIGTLSLSLVIPLNMIADGVVKDINFGLLFYLGTIPIVAAFIVVSFLTHWENWDPVLLGFKRCLQILCRRRSVARL